VAPDDDEDLPSGTIFAFVLPAQVDGVRLDKALADVAALEFGPGLSRARIKALMDAGGVCVDGARVHDASQRARAGAVCRINAPAPAAAEPQAEAIALGVLFEDEHLIVVDKPAGMAAHPAPGTPGGTLVNALLHHCGPSLSGIGGVARPGIVHRLDKDTSGVMVAAKTDLAHQGLSALFSRHDITRRYLALVRGAPDPARGRIATQLGRARFDRQRMAVLNAGGRQAVTHYETRKTFFATDKAGARPLAALVSCTLETGRTHQIRVHLAHKGAPVLGDSLYGSSPPAQAVREAMADANLTRQALHASLLGFVHPVTGEALRFETAPPADMSALESNLASRFFAALGQFGS